jgi:hypothetical protein
VVDNPTADDKNQPWVTALEFATDPGKGNATGKNAPGALAAITDFLFNGHGLHYSCRYGAPLYAYDVAGPAWSLYLSAYMNKTYGDVVNCYDQAVAVAALGDLLGINVEYCYMDPFGYINPTPLVGVPNGPVNNPFFLSPPPQQQLVGVDLVLPDRRPFFNHAFARYNGNIYDACAGPALGTLQATYLTDTIDRSPAGGEEARLAGDASNITTYPGKTINGVY